MRIRRPRASDHAPVKSMLADAGLPTDDFASEHLAFVVEDDGQTVAAIGFQHLGEAGLLRSLVVTEGVRYEGLGRKLVAKLETHASELGVREVYVFTPGADAYFRNLGYEQRRRKDAPPAIRRAAALSEIGPDDAVLMSKKLG